MLAPQLFPIKKEFDSQMLDVEANHIIETQYPAPNTAEFALTFLQYMEQEKTAPTATEEFPVDPTFDPSVFLDIYEGDPVPFKGASKPEFKKEQITNNNVPNVTLPLPPVPTTDFLSSKKDYCLKILGVPQKSRVETQLKLCVQLVNEAGATMKDLYRHLLFPDSLVVPGNSKKFKKEDAKSDVGRILKIEAGVMCSSDTKKQVFRCFGCIQRERKISMRKKKPNGDVATEEVGIEEERKKILQFYCNPLVDFSHGEAILPTRITCYCRHHDEKTGFQIWITLRDALTEKVVASGVSSQVMITDDHKKPKGVNKRPRTLSLKDDEELVANAELPLIEKCIPSEGPLSGGIEVTILGKQFQDGLQCKFGESVSMSTNYWGTQTLVSLLPAALFPGAVVVSLMQNNQEIHNDMQTPVMFTYKDDSERAMMELALQVVGMKLTGKIDDARSIAMQIVNSNRDSFRQALSQMPPSTQYHKSIEESLLTCLEHISEVKNGYPVNVSIQNKAGQTLLMLATIQGCHRLVKLLLQLGANVNTQDVNGFTALHFAVSYGYQAMVRLLLSESGRTINTRLRTRGDKTALDLAEQLNHKDILEILKSFTSPTSSSAGVALPKLNVHLPPKTTHPQPAPPTLSPKTAATSTAAASPTSGAAPTTEPFPSLLSYQAAPITRNNREYEERALLSEEALGGPNFFIQFQRFMVDYRALVLVGVVLMMGLVGLIGSTQHTINTSMHKDYSHKLGSYATTGLGVLLQNANTKVSSDAIEETVGALSSENRLDKSTGSIPMNEEEVDGIHPVIRPLIYWLLILSYFIAAIGVVSCVAYKYRRIWKVKTVVVVICGIFIVFAVSQFILFRFTSVFAVPDK